MADSCSRGRWPRAMTIVDRPAAASARGYSDELCRLFVTDAVVLFQPIEERRRFRILPCRLDRIGVPLALFGIVVWIRREHFIAPVTLFVLGFARTVFVDPLHDLFVARAAFNHRFEVIAFDALPAEEHVVERTIEM